MRDIGSKYIKNRTSVITKTYINWLYFSGYPKNVSIHVAMYMSAVGH